MTAIVVPSKVGAKAETSVASGGMAAILDGFRIFFMGLGFEVIVKRAGENKGEDNAIFWSEISVSDKAAGLKNLA